MRDSQEKVLLRSRRSFSNISSRDEAKLESMKDHQMDRVILSSEDSDFLGAILRPKAWPSFTYQATILKLILGSIRE